MSVWKPSVDVKLNAKQQKKRGGGSGIESIVSEN